MVRTENIMVRSVLQSGFVLLLCRIRLEEVKLSQDDQEEFLPLPFTCSLAASNFCKALSEGIGVTALIRITVRKATIKPGSNS
ncbi:MAG: hypothetical protein D3904_12405 [Candidatus Electrothrix sp. EH2]|nr:hypothetical protein [Candidatus Electrothrix sp. EH2]